jgi:hypothetical protein
VVPGPLDVLDVLLDAMCATSIAVLSAPRVNTAPVRRIKRAILALTESPLLVEWLPAVLALLGPTLALDTLTVTLAQLDLTPVLLLLSASSVTPEPTRTRTMLMAASAAVLVCTLVRERSFARNALAVSFRDARAKVAALAALWVAMPTPALLHAPTVPLASTQIRLALVPVSPALLAATPHRDALDALCALPACTPPRDLLAALPVPVASTTTRLLRVLAPVAPLEPSLLDVRDRAPVALLASMRRAPAPVWPALPATLPTR